MWGMPMVVYLVTVGSIRDEIRLSYVNRPLSEENHEIGRRNKISVQIHLFSRNRIRQSAQT